MAQHAMTQIEAADADVNIDEAVRESIEGIHMVRESRAPITVTVERGVVTLSGVVLSESMKRTVLYQAATTPGVVKVIDNLYEDPILRQAVATALAGDPVTAPHQPSITITCYLGMVTLTGPVLTSEVLARVREIATGVPGVREVFARSAS